MVLTSTTRPPRRPEIASLPRPMAKGAFALALVIGLMGQTVAQTAATAPNPAPAASPAKKELVAKLLKLQQPGIENMARGMTEQPAAQVLQQASMAMQRIPAEKREALARDIEADVRKYAEDAVPLVQSRATRLAPTTIGTLLEERFSEDELKQLIALLESPVNRKFQGMAGEMQRVLSEKLVAESRADIETRVRTMAQSVEKRLASAAGLPAAGEPAAKPAQQAPKK
jgi:hypothetical protein